MKKIFGYNQFLNEAKGKKGKKSKKSKELTEKQEIEKYILANVKEPAVILTIGAGDIYLLATEIFAKLNERK